MNLSTRKCFYPFSRNERFNIDKDKTVNGSVFNAQRCRFETIRLGYSAVSIVFASPRHIYIYTSNEYTCSTRPPTIGESVAGAWKFARPFIPLSCFILKERLCLPKDRTVIETIQESRFKILQVENIYSANSEYFFSFFFFIF